MKAVIKFLAERRLNFFDGVFMVMAALAYSDGLWVLWIALCIIGGLASAVLERIAGKA